MALILHVGESFNKKYTNIFLRKKKNLCLMFNVSNRHFILKTKEYGYTPD